MALMSKLDGKNLYLHKEEDSESESESQPTAKCSKKERIEVKLQQALSELTVPDISDRQVNGRGFIYTEEEEQYMFAVLRIFHSLKRRKYEAIEYLANALDRTESAVAGKLQHLDIGSGDAKIDDDWSSQSSSSSDDAYAIVDTWSNKTTPISQQELQRALQRLPVPDTSDRQKSGMSFAYIPAEDRYMLAVHRVFLAADRSRSEVLNYLAGKLDRTRKGITKRLRDILNHHCEGESSGGEEVEDASDGEESGSDAGVGSDSRSSEEEEVVFEGVQDRSRAYTTAETAVVCRLHEEYRRKHETPTRCYEAIAAALGRTEKSAKNKVQRLRFEGKLPQWSDNSWSPPGARSEPNSADLSRSKLPPDSRHQAENKRASTTHRLTASDSSDGSLYFAESDPDSDPARRSLSQVLSAHLQQPRTSHYDHEREGAYNRLGKRKWEETEGRAHRPSGSVDPHRTRHEISGRSSAKSGDRVTSKSAQSDSVRLAMPLHRYPFTADEDAALRAGFDRLSRQAGDKDAKRKSLCQQLAVKLSRRPDAIMRRAKLLGCWDGGGGRSGRESQSAEKPAGDGRTAPVVSYNAGSFTPEEDAIIWDTYAQHRTEASSSSAAASGGGTGGVLGYVSELAELLGRSYTQVQRRLDRLRAQDQAMPR
jgi:biotin operon repressor